MGQVQQEQSSFPTAAPMERLASHQPSDTTEEMSKRYANAYFLWTWDERTIKGQTILSQAKDHDEEMSLFFSTTSALEANCRVKGHIIKELSPYELYKQYTDMKKEPSFNGLSELIKVAEILKNTGAVELNPEGIPTMRCTISDYKLFDTKTPEGLSEALDHLRIHGPLVAVYPVTEYQRRNAESFGILHGAEEQVLGVCQETEDETEASSSKSTVCITGFGVEDLCSFLQFQKFRRVQEEKGMFGRVLASSILELIGLFVEAPSRCSKRQKKAT
ncbi:unnamed protein product [Urochloa humidicola]